MSRLPIRVRLTLIFTGAMAVVLLAVGLTLYVRLQGSLDQRIADRLAARTTAVAAGVTSGQVTAALSEPGAVAAESFAQLLAPDGRVVDASPGFGDQDLGVPAGLSTGRTVERPIREPDGEVETGRLRITPVARGGDRYTLVIGESLSDRDDALDGLVTQLWLLGPIALALSGLLGYLVSRAALRPVEAMRREAAGIDPDSAVRALPLPPARDEIHRLGETLNAMLVRLDEGLARERRFIADASHELRTPLSLLKTELELATRRPRAAAELEAALRSASEEVERLVRLTEDLLVLAAADEGRLPVHRSTFPVAEAFEAVATRFAARAAAGGRVIRVSANGQVAHADRERLEQAVGNLVDNALRHGAGPVELAAAADGGDLLVTVRDEGPGLPGAFLPAALDRFTQVDPARGGGSSGLGLAIVDAIARAHGGRASVSNRPGGGAEVMLRLPGPPLSVA